MLGDGDDDALLAIPLALTNAQVLEKVERWKPVVDTKQWGGVYHHYDGEVTQLQNTVWGIFNCSNTLYPQVGQEGAAQRHTHARRGLRRWSPHFQPTPLILYHLAPTNTSPLSHNTISASHRFVNLRPR